MKLRKWLLRFVLFIVVLVVSAAIYLELNKGKLIRILTEEINKSITGEFTHDGGSISILTSFPYINLSLQNAVLRDTSSIFLQSPALFESEAMRFCLDMRAVLGDRGTFRIKEVQLEKPSVYLYSTVDGQNNYSIFNSSESEAEAPTIGLKIDYFEVGGLTITYRDDLGKIVVKASDYDLNGDLTYRDDRVRLSGQFEGNVIAESGLTMPSAAYATQGDLRIDTDADATDIILEQINLVVNDFPLYFAGQLKAEQEGYSYQATLNSPANEVKKFLSLLPFIYEQEYGRLISDGSFSLAGSVSGSTVDNFPQYDIRFDLTDGRIKYPQLPGALENLNLSVEAINTTSQLPFTRLDIGQLQASLGKSRLSGKGTVTHSGKVVEIRTNSEAEVILGDFKNALYLADYKDLEGQFNWNGILDASIPMDGNTKTPATIRDMDIRLNGKDLSITRTSDNQQFLLTQLEVANAGRALDVNIKNLKYFNQALLDATGTVSNPVEALAGQSPLQAVLDIRAPYVSAYAAPAEPGEVQFTSIPGIELDITAQIDSIYYPPYDISGVALKGKMKNVNSSLDFVVNRFSGSTIRGKATFENILDYSLNYDTLHGTIVIDKADVNLNEIMRANERIPASAVPGPIVPANIDLAIEVAQTNLAYANLDVNDLFGKLNISQSTVDFENTAKLLGGTLVVTGSFDGSESKGSSIELNVDLKSSLFSETASKLKLFNTLVPISQYLEGQYNTTLNWNSRLDENYFPVMNTLTSFGVFESTNGRLQGFLPVDTVLSFLQGVASKRAWEFAATQTWFNVENGRVKLEDVRLQKGVVDVSLAGTHSFEQDMDYVLKITLPKKELKMDRLTGFLKDKLAFSKQLQALSDDWDVDVVVKLSGKVFKPKFAISAVNIRQDGLSESIKDLAIKTVTDEKRKIEGTVRDTINVIKTKVDSAVTGVKDSISSVIQREKEILAQQGKGLLDSLKAGNIDSTLQKTGQILKDKKKSIEDLKKILGKGLPKKKTKTGG